MGNTPELVPLLESNALTCHRYQPGPFVEGVLATLQSTVQLPSWLDPAQSKVHVECIVRVGQICAYILKTMPSVVTGVSEHVDRVGCVTLAAAKNTV